jgi:hypothetical protein
MCILYLVYVAFAITILFLTPPPRIPGHSAAGGGGHHGALLQPGRLQAASHQV